MASFYGNMKNNSRASFIFDKVYPTRTAMETALNAVDQDDRPIGDGIFVNRYVLVDYHYALSDTIITQDNIDKYYVEVDSSIVTTQNFNTFFKRVVTNNVISYVRPTSFNKNDGTAFYQKKVFLDRFEVDTEISDTELQETTSNLRETDLYYAHRYTDWQNYHASYDCTVWMKIYADNKEHYILVAELDAKAPILEFVDDAPSCQDNSGHLDVRASTDLNYVYFIPNNWNMVLNKYNPDDPVERDENNNFYWHYQDDKESNDLWYEDYILTQDTEVQSGKSYYEITFTPYQTEVGQSIKNLQCYIPKYEFLVGLVAGTDISEDELYEYIGGRYIQTEDTVAQGKPYYSLVPNEYMAADETVALEDVQYYRITSIERVPNLITGDDISTLGYYELNNEKKTFNDEVEYPYFNKAGFDPKVSNHVSTKGQGIFIKQVPSTEVYPNHKFVHAGILTASTYLPNRYYTYHGKKVQVPAGHEYNRDHAYYIKQEGSDEYQLIALILNDDGQYVPARTTSGTGGTYWYDEDLSNPEYFEKSITWSAGTAYYEITSEIDENGTRVMDHHDDTYRVDVYLPELGNTVADIYDVLYGAPIIQEDKTDGFNNLIGYCSKEQWASYNLVGWATSEQKTNFGPHSPTGDYGTASDYRFDLTEEEIADLSPVKNEEDGYIYPVYLMDGSGDYWASNRIFSLTDEQFNELSPEIYPGLYDIPVYLKEGSNVRPYNNERIKSTLTPPYDNLENENDISLGWSLTLLKRYLSELRYLAYGQDEEGHQIGLQTDWTEENDELIGYIQHRPVLITNFTKTADTIALPNKQYYRELVKNGEIVYESLSEHYDLLDGTDYGILNHYYENRKNIMAKVDSNNCETAILQTLFKVTPVEDQTSINSTNYLDANIWVKRSNTYEKATSYYAGDTYYESKPLEISDYSQWYYQRNIVNYIEITAQNPLPNNYEGIIYVDDNGNYRAFQASDYIGYYCDLDDDSNTPYDRITNSNYSEISNKQVYEYDSSTSSYVEIRYIGCYYQEAGFAYDPITTSNYDSTKQMWKEVSGVYSQVVALDYAVNDTDRYFYQTEDISYIKVNEDNFARERARYKQTGTNVFTPVSFTDFIDTITIVTDESIEETVPRYYILELVNNQTVYTGITAENAENIDEYDIYERFEGAIKVSQDLTNLGYTVFELPRTNTNNIEKNRDMYIQCSEYAIFDEDTDYYTYDGSRYVKAVYTLYDYDVEPIAPDYENNGLVQWDNGYSITIDTNNTIIQRTYSNINSKSLFDSSNSVNNNVVLYHNQMIDDVLTMQSVHKFSIVLDNSDNPSQDTPEIHAALEDLRNKNRADTLTFLNHTLVDNYGATYTIVSPYSSWPTKPAEDNNMEFYYAHLIINYTNFDLDADHFNANKTRYFTVEKVPIEQEDYEIHNIWNEVLEKVLLEP